MSEYSDDIKEISPTFLDRIMDSLLTFKDDIPNYIRKIAYVIIAFLLAINGIGLYATYRAYDALHSQLVVVKADIDKQLRFMKAKDYDILARLRDLQNCIHSEQENCLKKSNKETDIEGGD